MSKLNKNIAEIWQDDYVVPLYQRNYAWQEGQIQQLLQDIYDNSKTPESNYFIGSLVVLQRPDGIYEVIDGQQRLTTLHVVCKSLNMLDAPHLSYDSRPEVEEFFRGLFASSSSKEYGEECRKRDSRKVYRLVEAIDIVETTDIHTHPGFLDDRTICLSSMDEKEKAQFKEYLNNNVIIVRTVLPSDTDVAAYFEIMNNRGEQLQEHEIVKALMMKELDSNQRTTFSFIWDACSQMSIPVQRTLREYRLDGQFPLFGQKYDSLNVNYIHEYKNDTTECSALCIDEILLSSDSLKDNVNDGVDTDIKYEPIIDFPNFLMHLFKQVDAGIQLNANYLLDSYDKIKSSISSMDFIERMLKIRCLFDRYVIKSQGEGEEDEDLKWKMLKPYLFSNKQGNSLRFKNTFSGGYDEAEESELENDSQKRIVMQQSMLQVTFRNKKYKNWLFDFLTWLYDKDVVHVDPNELSAYLDGWILNYYDNLEKNTIPAEDTEWAFEALGTDTPHFVFNLIDYLYWVARKTGRENVRYINEIDDFYFRYYNSVEHHLPQSYEDTGNVNIDNIGNLCLISRRKNSSLNDKAPLEKAKLEPGLQPKRKIMYRITHDSNGIWGKKQIMEHCMDIKYLFESRKEILSR